MKCSTFWTKITRTKYALYEIQVNGFAAETVEATYAIIHKRETRGTSNQLLVLVRAIPVN